MSQIYLYAHGGSGNHGCEAIVRSTIKILNEKLTLISENPEEDRRYGVDKLCKIIKETNKKISKRGLDFLYAYIELKVINDYIPMEKLRYKDSFRYVKKGDLALSIGGDNYCYADVQKYTMLHDMMKKRGAKTVLWGCSVEPEVARIPEISADLARYDLITARESITYEVLKPINENTLQVIDTAFFLVERETRLPKSFIEGNTVGINLSPMVIDSEKVQGILWRNYINLIDHVLNDTDMNIAFIPHVVWENGDDRVPLRELYEQYKDTGRVCMVEDHRCDELKYIISKCRFFVGARTHSTIAAYSSGVPTLVVGYSVKAKGIARDLFGTEEGYVLPVQSLQEDKRLMKYFDRICEREVEIRDKLRSTYQKMYNNMELINSAIRHLR